MKILKVMIIRYFRSMKKLLTIIIVLCSIKSYSQNNLNYFITNTDEGAYLVKGERFPINISNNSCLEFIENYTITEGDNYIIIRLRDEMDNNRGVVIFDKNGNNVNFDTVQEQRKLQYKTYLCCIHVEELKGKLYFYDIVDSEGNDYDCFYDSQTDASNFLIPRYYIFDSKKNTLETIILKTACTNLIKDGKLICN
jgi:hypothetical protein